MKTYTFALNLLNHVRQQKTPPLARYCTLLAIVEAGRPLTGREIATRMKEDVAISGTLDSCVHNGLLEKLPTAPATYKLTDKGGTVAAVLLSVTGPTQPAAKPAATTAS